MAKDAFPVPLARCSALEDLSASQRALRAEEKRHSDAGGPADIPEACAGGAHKDRQVQ